MNDIILTKDLEEECFDFLIRFLTLLEVCKKLLVTWCLPSSGKNSPEGGGGGTQVQRGAHTLVIKILKYP